MRYWKQTILSKLIAISILLLLQESNSGTCYAAEFSSAATGIKTLNTEELRTELEKLFTGPSSKGIFWGISITKLKDDNPIYSLNDTKPFRPASNMKIIVAAAALKALGPNYKYVTKLFIDGKIKNGTLFGNLIAVGSGDPTFTSSSFDKWREDIARYGIKKIKGNIVGIDNIFDDENIGLLWSYDDLSNCYSAQVSGLQINSNCVEFSVTPGNKVGRPAIIEKYPDTSFVTIYNGTRTSSDKKSPLSFKRSNPDNNDVIINGTISKDTSKVSKWVSVNDPTKYFITLLYENLQKNGIGIEGKSVDADDVGFILNKDKAFQISQIESPPLTIIVDSFLKHSINLYGESLLKTLGFVYFNEGSTNNGRTAVKLILREYGLPEEDLFIADGCGLSNLNLISPRYMTGLLRTISKGYFSGTFYNSLSVSGLSGTLSKRLSQPYMKGAIHAKTGSIRNVRSLSGYIDTLNNERLAFSIFANNFDQQIAKAEYVIDSACELIRRYK